MRSRAIFILLTLVATVASLTMGRAVGPTDVAGIPASSVGVHGPTTDFISGDLQLVGHSGITPPGTSMPLGNNGAVSLIGNCAYVGRWHNYGPQSGHLDWVQHSIQILNVADPANPTVVGSVPSSTIPNAVAREIRAIDLPSGFKMLTVLTFGKFIDEGAYVSGQNAMYFYTFPSGNCAAPVLTGRFLMNPIRPHEFYQWLDPNPAHDVPAVPGGLPRHPRILEYITAPLSGVDGIVVDASKPSAPTRIGVWHGGQPLVSATESNLVGGVPAGAGRYSHSISLSADGRRASMSQWDGGFLTLDTSDFADAVSPPVFKPLIAESIPLLYEGHPGNTHSAVALPGTNDMIVGDEIYVTTDGCPFGWMRVLDKGDASHAPTQIGEFRLPENNPAACAGVFSSDLNADGKIIDGTFTMHNQTVLPGFVLTSWYGGGLRAIDVSSPAAPVEAGFFVPKPLDTIASVPDTSAPVYGETPDPADDWWVATWSYPVIRGGYIYVTDIRNGLYILQAKPGSPLAAKLAGINFLEGNSNLGDFLN